MTEVHMFRNTMFPLPVLLDTGAGVNSISEELLCGILTLVQERKVNTKDKAFPIVQLEYVKEDQTVTGVAKNKPISILGSGCCGYNLRR